MTPREIETRIRAVVLDVEQRLASGERALSVGVLSADDRDAWAAVRVVYLTPTLSITSFPRTDDTYFLLTKETEQRIKRCFLLSWR